MGKELKSVAKTTETSLELIDALLDRRSATIDELSEILGIAPSTVHRHLMTLHKHGYVVREEDRYRVGLQFLTVGGYVQRMTVDFPLIKEKVDSLASKTGERAQFIVEENGERIYLYTEVGSSAVPTGAQIGKRGTLHTSAAGKAILANLPVSRVEEIVDEHGLPKNGKNSITSREELYEELETIRERGYAYNRQETTEGVHAVGAAVHGADGKVIGALSVSGPASRMRGDRLTEELPQLVLGMVNELELHIKHSVGR